MQQGRRSRLIIRRVDPWTILKFAVLLFTSTYFVILVAGGPEAYHVTYVPSFSSTTMVTKPINVPKR